MLVRGRTERCSTPVPGSSPARSRSPASASTGRATACRRPSRRSPRRHNRPMAGEDQLDRGRTAYARREWRDAHAALAAAEPLGAATSSGSRRRPTCSVATTSTSPRWSGPITSTCTAASGCAAARCAFWIAVNLSIRGATGPARPAGSAAPAASSSASRATASSAATCSCTARWSSRAATPTRRSRSGRDAVAIAERFGDPDLFALAAQDEGILLIERGRGRGGARAARRGDGGRHRGRAVADRQRLRLLRRDHGLPAAYEPRRAQEWTAALSRWCDGSPTWSASPARAACTAPSSCSCTARGTRRWRGRRARERCELAHNPALAAQALYRQGELHRLRGERRRRGGYRAARDGGLRAAAGPLAAAAGAGRRRGRPARRSGACSARPTRPRARRPASPLRRDHARRGEVDAAARRLRRARGDRRASTPATCSPRRPRPPAARSSWPPATRGPRSSRCAAACLAWRELRGAVRGGARAACCSARVRARSATTTRPTAELARAREAFAGLGAAPDVERVDALRGGRPGAGDARPDRRASCRCCGSWPRAEQPRDRVRARDQRAHRRPPPAEHLRQARRLVADRGDRVRVRARPRLVGIDHAPSARGWSESARCRRPRRRAPGGRSVGRHGDTDRQAPHNGANDERERDALLDGTGMDAAAPDGGGCADRRVRGRGRAARWCCCTARPATRRTGCACSRSWTATHRVIAPDLPGHGGTATTEDVLAWLDDVIEQTCAERPALVGHTLGAAIAARFAAAPATGSSRRRARRRARAGAVRAGARRSARRWRRTSPDPGAPHPRRALGRSARTTCPACGRPGRALGAVPRLQRRRARGRRA